MALSSSRSFTNKYVNSCDIEDNSIAFGRVLSLKVFETKRMCIRAFSKGFIWNVSHRLI